MSEVVGKYGIRARVLKKSKSSVTGIVFTTYEIEYPRMILAELNTHRDKSRNSASSRAIPFLKMLEQLTARPVRFGANQPGMQDKGEDFDATVVLNEVVYEVDAPTGELYEFGNVHYLPADAWDKAKESAIEYAKAFYDAGYHKQVYNRLLEPFQMMKTVISGTEWANFFWLRDHEAADPTIAELARVMHEADLATEAEVLEPGEWHLPYVETFRDDSGGMMYRISSDWSEPGTSFGFVELEDAIKVSCARCAAVSFRNEDYGLEKSKQVYDRLVGDERKHASAFEHCATPAQQSNVPFDPYTWENGISHVDRNGNLWSGNLKGFVQYRKLIPGENYDGPVA